MTRTLIAAAALLAGATFASAAAADVSFAIAQENASREVGDRITASPTFRRSAISSAASFETARAVVNASADSQDGRILGGGTVLSGEIQSARAAAIVAELRAASLEDE